MANKLKAELIIDQIKELMVPVIEKQKELKEHQEKCQHARGTIKYGANTGHFDPDDDMYWIDVHCDVCFKDFTLDTEEVDCRKYTCNQNFLKFDKWHPKGY